MAFSGSYSPPPDRFLTQVKTGFSTALSYFKAPEGKAELLATCLVAFSGGPDSTALLSATAALADQLGLSVRACHVNHLLRGKESDADEQFCRQLASQLGIPLDVHHLERSGKASEAALREARYRALAETAQQRGCRYIVLGHTLDDQIETFFFRLCRGTGPGGLTGMEPARCLKTGAVLLRPLLSVRRADCLAYLNQIGQTACCDTSNQSLQYTRNYIRHQLLPPISKRFPGFECRIHQLQQLIKEDEQFWQELVCQEIDRLASQPGCQADIWTAANFGQLPKNLSRRILAHALSSREIEVSFERVETVLDLCSSSGAVSLSKIWDLRVEDGLIQWLDKRSRLQSATGAAVSSEVALRLPGTTLALPFGCAIRADEWQPGQALSYPGSNALACIVDLKKAAHPLVIRTRRPGDLIRPFGMNKLVKLKKFLHNKKLSAAAPPPPVTIVIADQEEVLWVPGIGLSNKVRVQGLPTHCLTWQEIAGDESGLC